MSLVLLFRRWLAPEPPTGGAMYRLRASVTALNGPTGAMVSPLSLLACRVSQASVLTAGATHV